jgi:hypothetical protein
VNWRSPHCQVLENAFQCNGEAIAHAGVRGGRSMFGDLTVAAIAMIAAEIVLGVALIGMFLARPRSR